MSPEFRSTVRKRFIWLASAGSLALLVASCEWFYSSEPRFAPGAGLSSAGHTPNISGGGIGKPTSDPPGATSGGTLGRSTGTGTRGPGRGAVGSGEGGNGGGGNGGGAGH